MATTIVRDPDTILRAQSQKFRKGRHSAANLFSFDDYNKEIREVETAKREARRLADKENAAIDALINLWLDVAWAAGLNGVVIDPGSVYAGRQAAWEVEKWLENTGRGRVIEVDVGDSQPNYRLVLFPNKMQAKSARPAPKRERTLLA